MINRKISDAPIDKKQLIDLFYTALMLYLVFTFAEKLLQGLISDLCIHLFIYTIIWLCWVIQTTYAYTHIYKIKKENYKVLPFISDCIDIGIALYICSAIGVTASENHYELTNYCHISVPFFILSFNQFLWYVGVKEFNSPALLRLVILFFGMLVTIIGEVISHNVGNLVAIVVTLCIFVSLRITEWEPQFWNTFTKNQWSIVKVKYPKLYMFLKKTDKQ